MDLKKAATTLGIDLSGVLTDGEIANLEKMPAKKAKPMIEDAFNKAHKAAELARLLAEMGLD
ncbi:MAG: hypothetical protein ACI82Z_001896 [Cellvibrionaceae bacterium]|jgi:hypothetical protein